MPANRMSHLEIFIGTWNTTGKVLETEAASASTLVATDTYRWLPGNQFIAHEADARFGTTPSRSLEIIGFDSTTRKHFARSFDDQGKSELFEVALKRKQWTIIGESVRFSGKFDAKGSRLTGLWELKGKKAGWQPWIELQLTRA